MGENNTQTIEEFYKGFFASQEVQEVLIALRNEVILQAEKESESEKESE